MHTVFLICLLRCIQCHLYRLCSWTFSWKGIQLQIAMAMLHHSMPQTKTGIPRMSISYFSERVKPWFCTREYSWLSPEETAKKKQLQCSCPVRTSPSQKILYYILLYFAMVWSRESVLWLGTIMKNHRVGVCYRLNIESVCHLAEQRSVYCMSSLLERCVVSNRVCNRCYISSCAVQLWD